MINTLFAKERCSDKASILFISPTMPARTGFGSAMRAACLLEALAVRFNILLFVIPVYGGQTEACSMTDSCAQVAVLLEESGSDNDRRLLEEARQYVADLDVDAIHVFGLILAPTIDTYLRRDFNKRPTCTLDLDDFESQAGLQIAELYQSRHDFANAARQKAEALRFAEMEREYLKLFDMVYVANDLDCADVRRKYQCSHIAVVPNAVRMPVVHEAKEECGVANLLFVGTMDYFPNQDAVLYFCDDILPSLRERVGMPLHLYIVGQNPGTEITALAHDDDVRITGAVVDLEPYYRAAHVVIVPIRAGGGTRIKILEAFSYCRPVVSTSKGAEGLDVRHGRELLIGNTAEEFAGSCLALLRDGRQRAIMTHNALAWVRDNHTMANVRHSLARAWASMNKLSQSPIAISQ